MIRAILAVIVGYVALFVWVFATMTVAWLILGQSFALESDNTTTPGWCVIALVLGFIGAILAGLVTAAIARSATPVKVLAGLVLVLGLAEAVYYQVVPEDDQAVVTEEVAVEENEAAAEMTVWEAAGKARPLPWYSFTIPFVGLVGVLIGGRMRSGGAGPAVSPARSTSA